MGKNEKRKISIEKLRTVYKKEYEKRKESRENMNTFKNTEKDIEKKINKLLGRDFSLNKEAQKISLSKYKTIKQKMVEIEDSLENDKIKIYEYRIRKQKLRNEIKELQIKLDERTYKDMAKIIDYLTDGKEQNTILRDALGANYVNINKEQEHKPGISRGTHAEMRVLQYINDSTRNLLNQNPAIYIGISKLCCRDCANIVQQMNEKSKGIVTEVDNQRIKQVVETRGFHNNQYPWPEPPFVKKYHFKLLSKAETKTGKAKEMHSDSESSAMKTEESNLEYLEPLSTERRFNSHPNVEVNENIITPSFASRVENYSIQARDCSTQTNRVSKNHTNVNQYTSNQERRHTQGTKAEHLRKTQNQSSSHKGGRGH